MHRQIIRKDHQQLDIEVDPVIRLHYVEVDEPLLESPSGDLERLLGALRDDWGLSGLTVDTALLSGLQACLREGRWSVTVAVREASTVVAIWPGLRESVLGVAVDVGSTTVAAHLCDLSSGEVLASSGVMNPQIRFGEDLMSRVSHIMLQPDSRPEMTRVVQEAVNGLVVTLIEKTGLSTDDILEIVLVGNPIMHHLLVGISPVELGMAPFALATDAALSFSARDLGLALHPGARAYLLPCIAGMWGPMQRQCFWRKPPGRQRALRCWWTSGRMLKSY